MEPGTQSFEAAVRMVRGRGSVALPFDPNDVWGVKAKHHISGVVNGVVIRGPLAEVGGVPSLVLPPGWLRDTPLKDGERVRIAIWPEGPQAEALPADIAAALAESAAARAFFDSLATFYRKAYLTWLAGAARRPEVQRERLAQFIELLEAGKKERPR
jgi:hypothetical protein